jgi:hydroxyethylthiazole kinase-like uncharacterized protein yjeF
MIKILSASQIKQLDAYTIQHEPIASIDLMERACQAFVNWFVEHYDASHRVGIVCGTGNNGGDGLGIARLLLEWNYPVKVYVVRGSVSETIDFQTNLGRLKKKWLVEDIIESVDDDLCAHCTLIIDALFGSGLSRPLEGVYQRVVEKLNSLAAIKIAVDIPSGLLADQHSSGTVFKATHTLTFQLPKLAFLMPENEKYVGEWHVLDIGLSKDGLNTLVTNFILITHKSIKKMLKPRHRFDHKGKFGHALLIAGSRGKMGAAVLAAQAALRAGPGLLTVHVPAACDGILHTSIPEAMVSIDSSLTHLSSEIETNPYQSIGIGPGLGQHPDTIKALQAVLEKFRKPMVIDADAINILSSNKELYKHIPEGSILTPHPKEFERLAGNWQHDFEKLENLRALSRELKSVVVLKGAYSAVSCPDGSVYFNPTGNPGMAKGGSGDTLTGILTGLLAQGYSVKEVAILGVYLHGLAGDLAVREKGYHALLATDLIDYLPAAFKRIE